jgi:hypothetical protein
MIQVKTVAETNQYVTYKLNGITYVPHYTKDCYVGPNYSAYEGIQDNEGNRMYFTDRSREYSAYDLEKAGAKKVVELLWTRGKHKIIK